MLDYQRIVDDVRSLIGSQNAEKMDYLRAAAADYSVACDEANERLSQCGSLLRKGLRSEAIQLCEIEPNLLDVVAILDFPERSAWTETANRCGIAPPPAILLDVAAALNEAYALEQPLAALLQQHRLLALTHGSLSARIQVLRRLAELDINNPVWQEDLKVFEIERQKQIKEEVKAALHAGDTATLKSLDAELSSPQWMSPPPPELARSAVEAYQQQQFWSVQSQFDKLATELESARSGFHVELGRTLRARWDEIIATFGWQPQEHVANRVAPALDWLNEQDAIQRQRQEHEAVLDALSRAASHGQSLHELQELYHKAVKFGALPTNLEERYQSRLITLQRAARFRRWLHLSGIAAGVVILVLVIEMIVSHERSKQQLADLEKSIPFWIEHGQFEQADAKLQETPESVKQDIHVRQLIADLEEAKTQEAKRKQEFTQRLKVAQHWLDDSLKMLDKEPGQTGLDRLYGQLGDIENKLQSAGALARTDDERAQITATKDLASQAKDKWQEQLDKSFRGQYEELDNQLIIIESGKNADSATQKANLDDFKERVRRWEATSKHVSPALAAQIITLKEHLSAIESGVKRQDKERQEEKQITAAVGDIPGYLKALQEYVKQNPYSDRTSNFKQVIEEYLCWQAVADWDKLARQSHDTGIVGLRPAEAAEQVAIASSVSDSFGDCAECSCIRQILPYLKAIASRDNGGQRLESPLKKLFGNPLLANIWMVEKLDGQRYYVDAKPEGDGVAKSFKYIIDFDRNTKGGLLMQKDVKFVGRAPQVAIAEQIQPILNGLDDENWESSFYKMIRLIYADDAVDPILKLNLLQQVLEVGIGGSYCLAKTFGDHLAWIKAQEIDTFANWLDPMDLAAANTRKDTAKKLVQFPSINKAAKAAAEDLKTIRQQRITGYHWVGWLRCTRDGCWDCAMNGKPDKTGRLFVVYRESSDTKPLLGVVGHFDHNTTTIDVTSPSLLVQGRPVYLESP